MLQNRQYISKEEREFKNLKNSSTVWLQYMDTINILCKHIKAERTGNWDLHLQTASEMLPYTAAAGHNNYTKSLISAAARQHVVQSVVTTRTELAKWFMIFTILELVQTKSPSSIEIPSLITLIGKETY